MQLSDTNVALYVTLHGALLIAWFAFFAAFIAARQKTSPNAGSRKTSSLSRAGVLLQGVGLVVAWVLQRQPGHNLLGLATKRWNSSFTVFALTVLAGSVWLAFLAARTLGKQWSLTARLLESHELITAGPYRVLRHPIYSALSGMLIGTLLVHSHWMATVTAIPLFALGTWIRIREEDRLLQQRFGPIFENYRKRVPALLPRIW